MVEVNLRREEYKNLKLRPKKSKRWVFIVITVVILMVILIPKNGSSQDNNSPSPTPLVNSHWKTYNDNISHWRILVVLMRTFSSTCAVRFTSTRTVLFGTGVTLLTLAFATWRLTVLTRRCDTSAVAGLWTWWWVSSDYQYQTQSLSPLVIPGHFI